MKTYDEISSHFMFERNEDSASIDFMVCVGVKFANHR